MPGIALPTAISVAQFQPDPHAQSFSEIFDQTMGNLGSPSDGFDAIFNATVSLQPPGGASDTILGPAQASIAAVRTAIHNGPLRTFLSSFSGALAAGTAKYNTFVLTVGPDGQPIGTVGSSPTPAPTPTPTPGAPVECPANVAATVLAEMTVGDAPRRIFIDSYQSPTDPVISVKLLCGDPAIFSTLAIAAPGGQGSQVGAVRSHDLYYVITPAKAGTFTGGFEENDRSQAQAFDSYYTVTIKERSVRPQPIGPGPIQRVV
jgi:hypothetical protein